MVNRTRAARAVSLLGAGGLALSLVAACSTDPEPAETPSSSATSESPGEPDVSSPTPSSPDSSSTGPEETDESDTASSPESSESPEGEPDEASSAGDDLAPPTADDQRGRGKGSGEYDLVLTDVRIGSHSGYDRVVMEFEGSGTPGWRVRYVKNPRLDGSGRKVRLDGTSALSIVADHTTYPAEDGTYYDGPNRLSGPGAPITDAYVGGTFEGYTAVFAGIDGPRPPFRVLRLTDPVRLVVDVAAAS